MLENFNYYCFLLLIGEVNLYCSVQKQNPQLLTKIFHVNLIKMRYCMSLSRYYLKFADMGKRKHMLVSVTLSLVFMLDRVFRYILMFILLIMFLGNCFVTPSYKFYMTDDLFKITYINIAAINLFNFFEIFIIVLFPIKLVECCELLKRLWQL